MSKTKKKKKLNVYGMGVGIEWSSFFHVRFVKPIFPF